MGLMRAQSATQLHPATCCPVAGQGATEYLILLSVVLIVALVSVALLGFFPGMASDAQITQSQIYWGSASPIAIIEAGARGYFGLGGHTIPYLRIKNTGPYKITITKVWAGNSSTAYVWRGSWYPINLTQDLYTLSPGEESYFNSPGYGFAGTSETRFITVTHPGGNQYEASLYPNAQGNSYCGNSPPYGYLILPSFGFEYIQYIEGQPMTKRQIGSKPLIIKCKESY